MIQIANISEALFSSELTLFQKKLIHIVCQADKNPDSYCMKYLNECQDLSAPANDFIDHVNKNNEVGCLYPKYNLSLIPNIDLTSDIISKLDQLEFYLTDVIINANELYYKCETILFVFEQVNTPDTHAMNQIFERLIEKHASKVKHLNTILTNLA